MKSAKNKYSLLKNLIIKFVLIQFSAYLSSSKSLEVSK